LTKDTFILPLKIYIMRIALIIGLLVSINNIGHSQKMVFFEKLTNAYCGSCPNAALIADAILEAHPNTIMVNHHKPITWTENPLINEQSAALWNDLDVPGQPLALIDRKEVNNSILLGISKWEEQIELQSLEPHYANLTVEELAFNGQERLLEFAVKVNFDVLPEVGPYRINIMMVEDSVWGTPQHSHFDHVEGHPLEGLGEIIWGYPHRHVVRAILDSQWGTSDVIPNSPIIGEDYTHTYSYVIPEEYKVEKLSIVCMLSQYDENDDLARHVFNASRTQLSGFDFLLSSDDLEENFLNSVYPNPTHDLITMEFENSPKRIQIFSQKGALVYNTEKTKTIMQIDVSAFESGLYFINVEYSNSRVTKPITILD